MTGIEAMTSKAHERAAEAVGDALSTRRENVRVMEKPPRNAAAKPHRRQTE